MPTPIICVADPLRHFAEAFRGCFTKRQWKYFVTVLLALVQCEARHTLTALLRTVGEPVSLSGLSRFLSRASWSPEAVAALGLTRFRHQMAPAVAVEHQRQRAQRPHRPGRPTATQVTGYLIVDDSVHEKPKGNAMAGLGRHFSPTDHRIVTGHVLVTGLYRLLGRRCPLPVSLYRQEAVCRREGVPFASKVDLALALIEQFEPVPDTHTHLLIDSWYHNRKLSRAARQRGWDVSGGVKGNRMLRQVDGEGNRTWVRLAAYAAQLPPEQFEEARWPGADGGRRVYVHAVRTRVKGLGARQVLITLPERNAPLSQARYFASTRCEASIEELLQVLSYRWAVEVLFEDYKDLLGSDQYQVTSAAALVRYWTLIACLASFLDEQRAQQEEASGIPITWGEVRRDLQRQHCRNLLTWLEHQFRTGATVEALYERLAA
ncbi:MAG: transposase [Acidobacteriia bacterium]|nr:transposase [Terriglobia bacterium]